jgi:cytoskeleton protein RodZ
MTRKKRRERAHDSLPFEHDVAGASGIEAGSATPADFAPPVGSLAGRRRGGRPRGSAAGQPVTPEIVATAHDRPEDSGSGIAAGLAIGADGAVLEAPADANRVRASGTGEAAGKSAAAGAAYSSEDALARETAGDATRSVGEAAVQGKSVPVESSAVDAGSLAARLRAGREARGLSREALAAAARIPLSAIGHIEANRLGALGAPIYARGFLRSYARSVGVAEVVVDAALRDLEVDEPALVVVNPASVGDRFAARYKNPLVYALLTLVVVVPLVFLATPQAPREPAQAFTPLDESPPASMAVARTPEVGGEAAFAEAVEPATPKAAAGPPPAPVMASMAPMASAMVAPRPVGTRVLVLRVSEPSWIELIASDGSRLEYAQLPAGTTREYVVDGGADLVVGNVPGVVATLNGRSVDLNAAANRNVARLRVGDAVPYARP